ncbi:MAG: hypothetical protein JSS94_05885 [Bacteroidetes bacterium]|nr:hypothetical protein [Bacteroidota bacterium]
MKKLMFLAALVVAGMVSGKSGIIKENKIAKQSKKIVSACVSVTFSCGEKGIVCGKDTEEIGNKLLWWDNLICPKNKSFEMN